MVIPLRSLKHFPTIQRPVRLTPILTIEGEKYLLETPKMGAVLQRELQSPITSLAQENEQSVHALDFLFQGYGFIEGRKARSNV